MRVIKASRRGMGGRPPRSKPSSPKQIVCADRTRRFTPDQLVEEITEPRIEGLLAECGIGITHWQQTSRRSFDLEQDKLIARLAKAARRRQPASGGRGNKDLRFNGTSWGRAARKSQKNWCGFLTRVPSNWGPQLIRMGDGITLVVGWHDSCVS